MNIEKIELRRKYLWWCQKTCELDGHANWPSSAWIKWFVCGACVPPISNASLNMLKACWDEWGNYMDDESQAGIPIPFHYEDVHEELNKRGYGSYCAV